MKKLAVSVLDDTDEESVGILMDLGLKRNVARTLMYLANADDVTSRSIELGANLRQPEVSIAMRKLKEENWVVVRDIKREGKGRPLKSYKLAVPIEDIITRLEEMKRQQAEKDLENIKKLRKLSHLS
ncbi:MAG: ArsR family transcriptional regulator [Methanocellales archaeon]|nr:ArsR family transcriptional regulator [Methanocellales archaeon]MDD3291187.1 ArsR family transcriptional regulator [Methanocellales archaeon]MDD5235287.1 ArsR family transcriptional regulator [Methanocellales archaeon]MDD5484557.1 ArsR family transcriptional regulator [Methanocellales archaeon]